MAKKFFREKGIDFEEFDVAIDVQARKRMVDQSGQLGVPVITVDGEVVVGFDQKKLEELLSIK